MIEDTLENTKIYGIFPTPVMTDKFPREFTKEEIEGCYNIVNSENISSAQGNLLSLDRRVLDKPFLQDIRKFIEKRLECYTRGLMRYDDKTEFYITQSFLNLIEPGKGHHAHLHPNSIISGVLYLEADCEHDKIWLFKKDSSNILITQNKYNEYNSLIRTFDVNTGDIILFPSNIEHSVKETTSGKNRFSLVFNTFIKGEIGSYENLTDLVIK